MKVLKLLENEYISNISGTGVEFLTSLTIETNFYRKIRIGDSKEQNESNSSFSSKNIAMKEVSLQSLKEEPFSLEMPSGSKIV